MSTGAQVLVCFSLVVATIGVVLMILIVHASKVDDREAWERELRRTQMEGDSTVPVRRPYL